MSDESAAKVRNMLSKSAFQSIIDGFWQTRVANGLTMLSAKGPQR